MRENRPCGLEGGAGVDPPFLPLSYAENENCWPIESWGAPLKPEWMRDAPESFGTNRFF